MHSLDWELIGGTALCASLGWCLLPTNFSAGAYVELDLCYGGVNLTWALSSMASCMEVVVGCAWTCFAAVINGTNGTRAKWSQFMSRISVNVHFG